MLRKRKPPNKKSIFAPRQCKAREERIETRQVQGWIHKQEHPYLLVGGLYSCQETGMGCHRCSNVGQVVLT